VLSRFDDAFAETASQWFAQMADALTDQLQQDGVSPEHISLAPTVDCRYVGQGFELAVTLDGLTNANLSALPEAFHSLHRERYGHANEHEDIEIVTLRLGAIGTTPHEEESPIGSDVALPSGDACIASTDILIPGESLAEITVWDRSRLVPGNVVTGPAIVHQMDATTLILTGQYATVTPQGDIRIQEST